MAHSNALEVSEDELAVSALAGHWVAVNGSGDRSSGGIPLPSGAVVVDHDTELDLLCQRVAAAGQSGLTIYLYQGEVPAHYADQEHYLSRGHWPGPRGHA